MDEQERAAQVALATAGDEDALQRLIVCYEPQLRALLEADMDPAIRRYFDVDDVLQEACISAFKAASKAKFNSPGGFYKWLEKIARNQLRMMRRALRRKIRDIGRRAPSDPGVTASYVGQITRLISPESTPSGHLAKGEAAAAAMTCLARLTDDQRTVVILRFFEGRPVADVAQTLRKTEDAVHKLSSRALQRLNELMGSITRFLTHA
jgi:RNA polymerase sigma-70 factor (subfamily 1)